MADAGVVRDADRLPWLEPYRAPKRTQEVEPPAGCCRRDRRHRPGRRRDIADARCAATCRPPTKRCCRRRASCCRRRPTCSRRSSCRRSNGTSRPPQIVTVERAVAARAAPKCRQAPDQGGPDGRRLSDGGEGTGGRGPRPRSSASEAAIAIASLAAASAGAGGPARGQSAGQGREGQDGPAGRLHHVPPGRARVAERGARLYLSHHHAEEHRADLDPVEALLPAAARHSVEAIHARHAVHQF